MALIDVDGIRLEVLQIPASGAPTPAAPLVFLHEGLGSVAMWRDWPARLCQASGRAGVVYSRQGYGQSEPIADVRGQGRRPPDYMHREAWVVLPALLARLGIERPILIGHSDGASIALLHASRHVVEACVVLAPHVVVEDVSIEAIEQARSAFESGELRSRLARYHADVECAFWQWNDAWLNPAFRDFDIRAECENITAPLLALQGSDDPYGTWAQIEQIRPRQAPVTRVELAHCGHSPQRDQAQRCSAHILEFLKPMA